jgi:hypothetical protein
VSVQPTDLRLPSTHTLEPKLVEALRAVKPGDKIRLVQTVKVGQKSWTTTVEGVFRGTNYLATGLATDRVPEDDIVVPLVHFVKPNGELASVALDEHSRMEVLGAG